MQMRELGRSGLKIPPIVFGGNVFGWTTDQAMAFRLLDACVDAGITAIDTADIYSAWVPGHTGGESETIIGAWIKRRGRHDDLVIMTKCGMEMPGQGTGLSAAWIARAAEASLSRLGIARIDLYQAHKDDAATPLEETLGAFAALVRAGKVRAIGASNYSPARLADALAVSARESLPRFQSLQPLYNLMERGIEDGTVPLCVKEQVGIIPYSSLASGFLTGKYRSEADLGKSVRGGRGLGRYLDARGRRVLAALDDISAARGAAPTQVALAWMLKKPGITAPIASATSPGQLVDLIKAATLDLSAAEVAALDAASAPAPG